MLDKIKQWYSIWLVIHFLCELVISTIGEISLFVLLADSKKLLYKYLIYVKRGQPLGLPSLVGLPLARLFFSDPTRHQLHRCFA